MLRGAVTKNAWKCIFKPLHHWIKCVLTVKESCSMTVKYPGFFWTPFLRFYKIQLLLPLSPHIISAPSIALSNCQTMCHQKIKQYEAKRCIHFVKPLSDEIIGFLQSWINCPMASTNIKRFYTRATVDLPGSIRIMSRKWPSAGSVESPDSFLSPESTRNNPSGSRRQQC